MSVPNAMDLQSAMDSKGRSAWAPPRSIECQLQEYLNAMYPMQAKVEQEQK